MFKKKTLFLFLISVGALSFFAVKRRKSTSADPVNTVKPIKSISLILPVNALVRPRLHLLVEIPEDFQSVLPLETMVNRTMNEFIPKSDKDVNHWTEIITTNIILRQRVSAKSLVDILRKQISTGGNAKLLDSSQQNYKNYSVATFTMAYTHKGRREIVFGKYLSGPLDCSGFQYAIALSGDMTEKEAVKKINDFVNKKTRLLDKEK